MRSVLQILLGPLFLSGCQESSDFHIVNTDRGNDTYITDIVVTFAMNAQTSGGQ